MKHAAFIFTLGMTATLAQQVTPPSLIAPTIEPGLEQAVKWLWQPEATDAAGWGLPIEVKKPELPPQSAIPAPAAPTTSPTAAVKAPEPVKTAPAQALDHTIGRGETLGLIARRYVVTVEQIKKFNSMTTDKILVGKKLRIPGVDDIKAMTPPPPPPPAKEEPKSAEAKKEEAPPPPPPEKAKRKTREEQLAELLISHKPRRSIGTYAWGAASLVRTQVFLDRQGYTIGPIDGQPGPTYNAAFTAFEAATPGRLFTTQGQPSAEMLAIGGAYTEYTLRDEDLRWISPEPVISTGKKDAAPPITLESLTSQSFLAYRNAWEFVAERFHASESFLRRINPALKNAEAPGTVFLVPNVEPFEIEKTASGTERPAADAAAPVKAVIAGLKRLIIRRGDVVVANMPISVARPGLRGRGAWVILEHIDRPCLISSGSDTLPLSSPIRLPQGPNNPVGFAWVHLAKASDLKPLPYGLHGTSIPGHMAKQESIGGFRLTNWDLARALRLLPVGTELAWE